MRRASGTDSRGFTLVEVLVVIGIIAVLAAVLFPVFGAAQAKARESVCASNLHQLHLGLEMYLEDNAERYPVSYVESLASPYESWRESIQPYVQNRDILICPAAEDRDKLATLSPERQASYALNAQLSAPDLSAVGGGSAAPQALAAVVEAAGTIELCDAGYSNAPVAADLDDYGALGMQEQPLPSERHDGAANFGFVDGHVQRMTEEATRSPQSLWDLE